MPDVNQPQPTPPPEENDFARLLEQYESQNESAGPAIGERRSGRVISVRDDVILVDVGAKAEGVLPVMLWRTAGPPAPASTGPNTGSDTRSEDAPLPAGGDTVEVVIEGRDPDGSFKLSPFSPDRPRSLEDARAAFEQKIVVRGKVTGIAKNGLTVDIGQRAFLPLSRSGVREDELHKLVGQEIRARILRAPERGRVVVDRRGLLEEERAAAAAVLLERLHVSDVVDGTVASVATYGAFVDLGGVDALLHVSDMSWTRLDEPARLLSLGDQVRVQVLKVDRAKGRVSVGLKQLQPDPWAGATERFHQGDRVRGIVQRLSDFGAFIEIEPGLEGLIHISEMSWSRRIRKPGDVVQVGEAVEAVVLGVSPKERRISLGLKQALGDPWADAETRFAPGNVIEGRVRNLQPFGAFVEISEGVDGMIHIGDIKSERLNHPSDALKVGDTVRAQVLELDLAKRRLRLGMRQLEPTPIERWAENNHVGDVITGRVIKAYPGRVELDEGINAACPSATEPVRKIEEGTLAAKLAAVWKRPTPATTAAEPATPKITLKQGEVRKFRLIRLEIKPTAIEVEPA